MFKLDVKCGLEEQPRQKDVEHQRLGQVGCFEGMQQPQHKAGEDQRHRVRNGQTLHRDRHGCGHNKQQNEDCFCCHYIMFSRSKAAIIKLID